MIVGFRRRLIRFRIRMRIYKLARGVFGSHASALEGLKQVLALRVTAHGDRFIRRFYKSGEKLFLTPNLPAWRSPAFDSFIREELEKVRQGKSYEAKLQSIIFSITARCSYHCEHCYESKNINSEELLTFEQLQLLMKKVHDRGIHHIQFSGGEPLARIDDLVKLLGMRSEETDYWILTSGHELTPEIAARLKGAGLSGAIVSLDHWDEAFHNKFRGSKDAFYWAGEAVKNCNAEGIATALSICATKAFLSEENLWKFAELAREWNVGFIRILEPRAVGKYSGKNVTLSKDEKKILQDFFITINAEKKYQHYPLVMYPGHHQKESGCFGAGNRYLYVDSKGDVHACPFCQGSVGNLLENELPALITALRTRGCHMFRDY